MASSSLFKVFFFTGLMVSCSCIAGTNELEGNRQGGDGYIAMQLMLKFLYDVETDMQELKADVEDTQVLKADMQQLKANTADDRRYIQELKAEIAELKSKNKEKPKNIFAQMQLLGTHTFKPGDRVYFTSTVANVGNAYDTQHGYFEAPYDGTYLFSVVLCTGQNNWVVFKIIQDGNNIRESFSGDSSWHACGPSTVVTQMKSGSRVWVIIEREKGGQIESGYGIPSFTGVFLNNYQQP